MRGQLALCEIERVEIDPVAGPFRRQGALGRDVGSILKRRRGIKIGRRTLLLGAGLQRADIDAAG